MIGTPQDLLRNSQSALTVEILREQLLQVPGQCVVAIDGVTMSQASHGFSGFKPGAKFDLTFVPLHAPAARICGCTIGKRDADCDLHREARGSS